MSQGFAPLRKGSGHHILLEGIGFFRNWWLKDYLGGPVVKTPCFQRQGVQVQSLARGILVPRPKIGSAPKKKK